MFEKCAWKSRTTCILVASGGPWNAFQSYTEGNSVRSGGADRQNAHVYTPPWSHTCGVRWTLEGDDVRAVCAEDPSRAAWAQGQPERMVGNMGTSLVPPNNWLVSQVFLIQDKIIFLSLSLFFLQQSSRPGPFILWYCQMFLYRNKDLLTLSKQLNFTFSVFWVFFL